MKLSLQYLNSRYDFWKTEIGRAGIWQPELFGEVSIHIRPKSKSYNGLFIRRYLKRKGKRVLVDRIFIYNNSEDFEPSFIDSVLVHEMIHQYIYQNKIKDSSTHGKIFKTYMKNINLSFPGVLKINISDRNPAIAKTGEGSKIHSLLLVYTPGHCFCCVIKPGKLSYFNDMAEGMKKRRQILNYQWATSSDLYFDNFTRCTKALHGKKILMKDLPEFLSRLKIKTGVLLTR